MKPWQRLSLSLSVHVALAETNGSEISPREGEVIFTAPSCRPQLCCERVVPAWSLPGCGRLQMGTRRPILGAQRMTPRSQHWLHRFKSEHTDALACPPLPGAVSLPRRRVGDGMVPPAPTGCHTLAFSRPQHASLQQCHMWCRGQTLPR